MCVSAEISDVEDKPFKANKQTSVISPTLKPKPGLVKRWIKHIKNGKYK